MHRGLVLIAVVSTSLACFVVSACSNATSPHAEARYSSELKALEFLPDRPCVAATPMQERRVALALEVLGSFSRHASIYDGAVDVFGHPRDAEAFGPGDIYCVSDADKDQVARLTVGADAWRGLVGMSKLKLAFQLGPRDPVIVQSVGRHAFADRPIEESIFQDTRVLARSVLASFGTEARPWLTQAMRQLSAKDSLGTSAAQVAAASGDPKAIRRVADVLRGAVDAEPKGQAISIEAGARITELAFALGAAREHARPYTPMIIELLNRDFTIGSHFGPLELAPTSMCRVLSAIGGDDAEAAIQGERCQENWHKWP